ncbi:hypothetical protein R5R35_011036 [Gryllus longicercus]|uniref:Sarcolemmal membrane-associated protein n=1 Tax=Gryllus longicercus TaxID=2509291 RepID=A0AAN9VA42_9ORTH
MVVVSGSWIKNVVSYPGAGDVIGTPKMAARAVLMCRPNSHPFQERTLTLDQPVKIGRSVARARASQNNAIFDCKVLSRNHALLWYENGKFYLQDTKSSNGTFVNNQRLSKGSEESPPREVCSGDIVQFGVDVMENARKVTHGCIVATLRLFLPDGKEAKASPSTSVVSSVGMVPLEDLYQLNQYLQDALQREQLLENKLAALQRLVENTRQASDVGWKALIDEDRLLSRVEILETQLLTYSKNFAEDKLRDELRKLQEDKSLYQGTAKESLRKLLQEKIDAVQRLNDLERTLSNTEDECAHLKEIREQSQQDLSDLAQKYSQQLQRIEDLSHKLMETEEQRRESCERLEQEKQELAARLEEQTSTERALQARIDALTKEANIQNRLSNVHSSSRSLLESKLEVEMGKATDSTGTQVDIILERIEPDPTSQDNMKEELESLRFQLKKSEEELKEGHDRVDELHLRLEESRTQEDSNVELTQRLEERLQDLEAQLCKLQADNNRTQMGVPIPNQALILKEDIAKLQELLTETRNKKREAEQQIAQVQLELDCAKIKVTKSSEEANQLKQQLQTAQALMGEESARVLRLEEQVQHLMLTSSDMKLHLLETKEKLEAESARAEQNATIAEGLHKELVEAQQSLKQSHNEAAQLKDKLIQLEKDSDLRNSSALDQLKQQCSSLQEEAAQLRFEHWQLIQRTTELTASNESLQNECERLSQGFGGRTVVKDLEDLQEKCKEADKMMSALEEELVLVKERYRICNDEKTQISKELLSLQEEFGNITSQSYAVPVHYVIAIIMVLAAVFFSVHQFL